MGGGAINYQSIIEPNIAGRGRMIIGLKLLMGEGPFIIEPKL